MGVRFDKKRECAICARTCYESDMKEQRGVLVCASCRDRE